MDEDLSKNVEWRYKKILVLLTITADNLVYSTRSQ